MLNILWPVLIIISIIFACLTGKINELNLSIFNSAEDAVKLIITFFGTICLWNGIIKVLQETSIMNKLKKIIKPFMKCVFPKLKENQNIYDYISINIVANILGLGNAATPLGLKAMNELQKENKNKEELSDSMVTLIVLNTASLQLIPTTVIAIRASLNSENPSSIILPVWISTICAALAGIIATKIFIRLKNRR